MYVFHHDEDGEKDGDDQKYEDYGHGRMKSGKLTEGAAPAAM
jgi:hypothetical protein